MYMKAALDANGKPTAWLQRSVFPPIGSTFALNSTYGGEGELGLGFNDIPFDIPNLRVENGRPRLTCASDGCVPSPTSITRSPSNRLPTNWRTRPIGIRSSTCSR